MKWFRFWNDTINDVKILQLTDYEYRMWTYLLSYASETDCTSGHFQVTFKLLSLHFHQRFNLFSRAIETFQNVGLITVDEDGYITITNWTKRQFKSDNAYERVKKFREVNAKRNVSVTAPETDTETDTEKKKKKAPPKVKMTDEEWLNSLKSNTAYANLDIPRIKGKCEAWCALHGKVFTRKRFLNWLNREDAPMKARTYPAGERDVREYKPEPMPEMSDEGRKKALEKIREFTDGIG
jgi:hypothetical protein